MRQRISKEKKCFSLIIATLFIFTLISGRVLAQEENQEAAVAESPEIIEKGKKTYEKNCINCHGEKGDAVAPASARLYPEPRDFTLGLIKMKTTARDELATDADIFNVITKGMPGTAMPAWPELANDVRWGLVYYIKSFSDRYKEAKAPAPIKVGSPIPSSSESIEKGKDLFDNKAQCNSCHGDAGRGNGDLALDLETDWETPIFPRDLTKRWTFRRGGDPEDIFYTIRIGVEGTPMPSFAEDLDEEETWHVVNYVLSLSSPEKPIPTASYEVKLIEGELPEGPDDEIWNSVPFGQYPMAGQIIIDPRMFTPKIDTVQMKALYNQDEIAFLLIWHDPSELTDEGSFKDAIALQLPQNSGGQKPYFLNGDPENPTYLLHWNAANEGSITEVNATGMKKMKPQKKENQNAKGAVVYDNGEYRLQIKRSLKTDDKKDTQFESGKFVPVAFSAWEGSNEETGTLRSISAWYLIILEQQIPSTVYYYPILAIFAVVGIEFVLISWIRKMKNEGSS
jgi:DMSO reductase family type II enzyme heme b subunit